MSIELSKIVTGVWNWGNLSTQEINSLIHQSIDAGITSFDHADIYGGYTIEGKFGEALKLSPEIKSKMQVITKCGIKLTTANRPEHSIKSYDSSKKHIITSAENSLKELNIDVIDYLLIHRPDPLLNPLEVADAFQTLKDQGKVKAFGVSNFLPHQVNALNKFTPLSINQIEISPLQTNALFDGSLDNCIEHGIKPMAWSPLGNGKIFSGESDHNIYLRKVIQEVGVKYDLAIDQTIFAWHLTHPAGITPVLGTTKGSRIETAAEVLSTKLEREDWFRILEASLGHEVP
ncbi:aldo/keto reductase [Flammeovirga kamogawensis]|uniref:Aldo/keto reductase n=1 Tax=Flammeovirga kamogawensis TaxID=373891 RepID=A0ABX8GRG3_9BACT|nr:aldo/keto reductase [Flammeovirga kamogawensis]MBB6462788.1 putative oxidoreductase [Flammeovirga kamogawensis]QWG05984.1 aldo/keto reductase [Flammeovirga kamogawensis]TRX67811.1 oxidoreductase [Flammeovirga kamogawensis]